MLKRSLLIVLLAFPIVFYYCSSPTESKNNPPEIKNIFLNKEDDSYWYYITAIAIDIDGDSLSYYWYSEDGYISALYIMRNPTLWRSTDGSGDHTITCTVSDGKSIDTDNIVISN